MILYEITFDHTHINLNVNEKYIINTYCITQYCATQTVKSELDMIGISHVIPSFQI